MLKKRYKNAPNYLLRPIPILFYKPIMQRMTAHIAQKHPNLFARLGTHTNKRFLINPTNMPFVLLLKPDPENPIMQVYRRSEGLCPDAEISGSFVNLLRLMDGELDGDSLFFSRDLKVVGDTEAVVCLRNALDDIDGSVLGDLAARLGRPGGAALSVLRRMEA